MSAAMQDGMAVARSELILGGQKSGKSRRAELLARRWLAASDAHRAILIATGQAHDDEMAERIARHRRDRAARVPGMATLEEPLLLAEKIAGLSRAQTLLVVDCLTLWLASRLLPLLAHESVIGEAMLAACEAQAQRLADAVAGAPGPVILVSNEIGLGVVPLGRQTRVYVDALGLLNQRLAAACERVTLVAAGLPLVLKGAA